MLELLIVFLVIGVLPLFVLYAIARIAKKLTTKK
jgi:competence protein ComGC